MENLITLVQTHYKKHAENLASEILALILREDAGQEVLRKLFRREFNEVALDEGEIEVEPQLHEGDCAPDIWLKQSGRPVGLLELKFWAPLTDAQKKGRYHSICPQVLFLVPEKRTEEMRAKLPRQPPVTIKSWEEFFAFFDDTDSRDQMFGAALAQFKEFCNVTQDERFSPFDSKQIGTPSNDDITTQHLVWLVREVKQLAVKAGTVEDFKLSAGYDTSFFFGGGRGSMWFGYWPHAWKKFPKQGPIWVQLYGAQMRKLEKSGLTGGVKIMGKDLCFPLFAPHNSRRSTQQEEAIAIFEEFKFFVERLNSTGDAK